MGHNKSFSVNDAYEFDEACFRRIYKPLSNLPTPPPSSRNSSATQSPRILADEDPLNSELLAPTIHLARLIPPGLSRQDPSFSIIQNILSHANLKMDIIAFAACILDALPLNFRHSWRMSFSQSRPVAPQSKRHTLPPASAQSSPFAADPVTPELAVLAALIIADKFVEDSQEPILYYASVWGQGLWSCEQVNATERCIMEALEYRILPLWSAPYIKQARHDIELVRRQLLDDTSEAFLEARESELYCAQAQAVSTGEAVVGLGLQVTPANTPRSELCACFDGHRDGNGDRGDEPLGQDTRQAFGNAVVVPQDYLHMPSAALPR